MHSHLLVDDYAQSRLRELRADGDRARMARPLIAARRARRRAVIATALAAARQRLAPARTAEPACCT